MAKPLKTVFICEDHPLFLQSLNQLVSKASGLQVVGSAVTVNDSLKQLSSVKPDIVLLDLNLGGDDGFQVLEYIRNSLPETMVMVLTSYNDSVLASKAKRLGASAYMLKDADETTLLDVIDRLHMGSFISQTDETTDTSSFESEKEFTSYLKLTRMEKKLVAELIKGASVSEAAELFFVSENTIKNHKKNIYRKLGINKQSELILLCQRHGLLAD